MSFKKITIIYLIGALLVGTISMGVLGYAFRDKLSFFYAYHKINKAVENDQGIGDIQQELRNLTAKCSDFKDILILDSTNKIIFSAQKSTFASRDKLELSYDVQNNSSFLRDETYPNIYFMPIQNEKHLLLKLLLIDEHELKEEYNNSYFFQNNFNKNEAYFLSYILDETNGNKIYFISDIKPVNNGRLYIKSFLALAMLFFMIYWILVALWIYRDAKRHKLEPSIWGIIILFTNIIGVLVYLIYKQNNLFCFKCGAIQSKDNIYCTQCSSKINEVCSHCEAVSHLKDNYCRKCGKSLS